MNSFNLANWEQHPSDSRYFVFRFNKLHFAENFEERLKSKSIEYHSHEEDGQYMFAVGSNDFDKARKLNYLVMTDHRKPMISNGFLRWSLVLFVIAAVTIAFIGHCNKKVLDQEGIHRVPLEKRDSTL